MVLVGLFMITMCILIWNTIVVNTEVKRRIKLKKHFELLREMNVKPEHYYRYDFLIKKDIRG
jgi:hypothetical protein